MRFSRPSLLIYPTGQDGKLRSEHISFTFDNNNYDPERQIRKTLEDLGKFSGEKPSDTWVRKIEERLFDGQNPVNWNDIKRRAAVKTTWQWHSKDLLDDVKALARQQGQWREEGGLVRKGPFAKEPTTVRVVEKHRKDNGEAVLEIKPVGGTKVYYEIGDSMPSMASEPVSDYNSFSTKELVISFLCVDEGHQAAPTGAPYIWKNRIEVKGREYTQGADRFVEIKAFPDGVPLRYTTNGSDPRSSGQPYEAPFLLPQGTRLVQAIAEKNGIVSNLWRMEIGDEPTQWRVDPHKPAHWSTARLFLNKPNTEAYQLISRIREYKAKATGVTLLVDSADTYEHLEYILPDEVFKTGEELEALAASLTALVPSAQITLTINRLSFELGQHLLDWQQKDRLVLDKAGVHQ